MQIFATQLNFSFSLFDHIVQRYTKPEAKHFMYPKHY